MKCDLKAIKLISLKWRLNLCHFGNFHLYIRKFPTNLAPSDCRKCQSKSIPSTNSQRWKSALKWIPQSVLGNEFKYLNPVSVFKWQGSFSFEFPNMGLTVCVKGVNAIAFYVYNKIFKHFGRSFEKILATFSKLIQSSLIG